MFKITKPKLVICESSNQPHVNAALPQAGLSSPVLVFGDSVNQLFEAVAVDPDHFTPQFIADPANTVALIPCSSGTTGFSKGVCYSHAGLNSQLLESWPMLQSDTTLSFSSLYWISGLITLLIGTVEGATRVITTRGFSADLQLELIEQYRITHVFSPPSHIAQLLECSKLVESDLTSVRLYLTGGSIVAEELRSCFEAYLPNGMLRTGYGMTELCVVSLTLPDIKPNSVGTLKARVIAKVRDSMN